MAVDQTTQAYIQAALRNQIAPSTLLWVWNGSTFVPWNAQIAGTVTTADASGVNMASAGTVRIPPGSTVSTSEWLTTRGTGRSLARFSGNVD